jgi:hypothetical protein
MDSLYFDDQTWDVRYLVVDTGDWLPGPRVLIHPSALGAPDWSQEVVPVSLTIEKIKKSPGIQTDRPVSRQYLATLHEYYSWPAYWSGMGGYAPYGAMAVPVYEPQLEGEERKQTAGPVSEDADDGDPHLRSTRSMLGYRIWATDGEVGHIDDFIVDDEDWTIRYLVVDTAGLFSKNLVLLSPAWIEEVSWVAHAVRTSLNKDSIERSPEFDPSVPVNREYEERLYDYYGRPRYWSRLEDEGKTS